jgi:hypothetical protein
MITVGARPVPAKLTVCGLPAASSVTTSSPEIVPDEAGLKVTAIWQLAPIASVAGKTPQLLV